MKEDDDADSAIFHARSRSSGTESIFWLWMGSSYGIPRRRIPDFLAYESDLERAYAAAKQIIIELWTIRAFLIKLDIAIDRFDELLPNLKAFRGAIAHIDERADGTMLVRGGSKTSIARSKTSLAGGLLRTSDGIHWTGFNHCYGLIGLSDGLYTAFGSVRNWIITNSDQGALELQLTTNLFEQIDDLIRSAAEAA